MICLYFYHNDSDYYKCEKKKLKKGEEIKETVQVRHFIMNERSRINF